MTTLYVCGPMTGLPELNFPAFFKAERELLAAGYHQVLNPAGRAGQTPDQSWEWYLRRGIIDVCQSDGIALLTDWGTSRGARLEVAVAQGLGIPCEPVYHWLATAQVATA